MNVSWWKIRSVRTQVTYIGAAWDALTGGKSSKLLKLRATCVGGDAGSLVLPPPRSFFPATSQPPASAEWPPRTPGWRLDADAPNPLLLLRPRCGWNVGLAWVSGGEVIKSARQWRWADRRSEAVCLGPGLHPELNDGLLKVLIPVRLWEAVSGLSSCGVEGAGEKSWTRLVLREPWLVDALLDPLRSLDELWALRDLVVLGVLAGVLGPWVRVLLLWSFRKFRRNGTNSFFLTVNSRSWSPLQSCHDTKINFVQYYHYTTSHNMECNTVKTWTVEQIQTVGQ